MSHPLSTTETLIVRTLGLQEYQPIWQAMQQFTQQRQQTTTDEIWLLEHPPIFTLGRNATPSDIISTSHIPIVQIDRGGQVTYHGPGQLIAYLMIDIKRRTLGVRQFITFIEQSIINTLYEFQLSAIAKKEAPGVYINEAKIAALGLRIKKGCSFHGLSLNIAMDLAPFSQINPCGYKNLEVVQLCDYIDSIELLPTQSMQQTIIKDVQQKLISHLANSIGYQTILWKNGLYETHND